MPNIDRNTANLNQDVFKALQKVKDPQNMTKAEAKNVRSAILKDGNIDAAEKDLLMELTQKESTEINVSAQATSHFNPSDLKFGTVDGEAAKILDTVNNPKNLNQLWAGGTEGWSTLIDLYDSSPVMKGRIKNFVSHKLYGAWAQSSLTNGYKPIRDLVGKAYDIVKTTDPETTQNGRNLLYDAMELLDSRGKDAIPDFIYNWLKTDAPAPPQS